MVGPIQVEVLSLLDHVFARTNDRLVGPTDDGYSWEPVSGCWTVGLDNFGDRLDGDDHPFTTIGWRMCHASEAVARHPLNSFLLSGSTPPDREVPRSAADGIDFFRRSYGEWRSIPERVDERLWVQPLSPAAGPFADSTVLAIALHSADELIHHTAEIVPLRDLYLREADL